MCTGNEALENGDELKFIFEGAGTKWIGEMEKEDHILHSMYTELKSKITGVCAYCAQAFGVKSEDEKAGLTLLDEYKNHSSLRNLFIEGYHVIIV
ncbi:MAG: DsrE family protein [Lentimicrobium sp.]|nr:DsrE family protein [Lentimicrobium sp.]